MCKELADVLDFLGDEFAKEHNMNPKSVTDIFKSILFMKRINENGGIRGMGQSVTN